MTTDTITTFAIFANGTYWGVWDGADAAAAIQAAADDVGTDGNTDGMTAKPINDSILEAKEGCKSNGVDIADVVCEFFNCQEADVDSDGDIWISGPQSGQWLSAEAKADFLVYINQ